MGSWPTVYCKNASRAGRSFEATLKTLTLSSNNGQSVLTSLHRQSNTLANTVDKKIGEAQQLVVERDVKLDKLNTNGDFDEDDENSGKGDDNVFVPDKVLEEEVQKLNLQINQLYREADKLLNHNLKSKHVDSRCKR